MTMATPTSRPTYAGWLDQIGSQGRTDEPGLVAAAWLSASGHGRPRLSAVRSVNAWLSEHPPPGVANLQATLHALEQAYHSAGGLPEAPQAPQPPPLPPTVFQPPVPFQQPAQAPDQPQQPVQPAMQWPGPHDLGQPPQQQPAPPAVIAADMAAAVQQQAQPAVSAGQQPAQPPEHPWQVVMLKLGQIEAAIEQFQRVLAPLAQLAAETQAEAAINASALAQPTQAQATALAIAQQQGWTPGPAFEDPEAEQELPGQPMPGASFYNHVAQQPDWAQMAADAQDAPDE